jgi:hypothetical protein
LELEEALRGGRETEELERELEEARREVLLLNAKQEKDSETIIAMRRQIEAVESEAEVLKKQEQKKSGFLSLLFD